MIDGAPVIHAVGIIDHPLVGRPNTRTMTDGWTFVAVDGKKSAYFSQMMIVREGVPEPLTRVLIERESRN